MIVCIAGPTCTGKTTTSRRLAEVTGLPLRSCGTSIRERAAFLGVAPEALSDEDHRAVDAQTVEWAIEAGNCLVEGRFLDFVFHDVGAPLSILCLTASRAVRAHRGRLRGTSTFAVEDVRRIDDDDAVFRARLYPWTPLTPPFPALDNSDLTVDECVRLARETLREALPQLG